MAKNGTDNDSAGATLNGHLSQRETEVVRLIGQHLEDLGLHKVARHLIEETGTELENQHATEFRCSILTGDWSKAIAALEKLRPEINRDEKVQVKHS